MVEPSGSETDPFLDFKRPQILCPRNIIFMPLLLTCTTQTGKHPG